MSHALDLDLNGELGVPAENYQLMNYGIGIIFSFRYFRYSVVTTMSSITRRLHRAPHRQQLQDEEQGAVRGEGGVAGQGREADDLHALPVRGDGGVMN